MTPALTLLILPLTLVACAASPQAETTVAAAPTPQSIAGAELIGPRTPALSPDGARMAFSHQGDIWVADVADGAAVRLTANPAYESFPTWSPDGRSLAFRSNRHGNYDIYSVPSAGGALTRMTYHSEHDMPHEWIDNQTVLLGAARERWYSRYGRAQILWSAHVDARTPELLGDFPAINPSLSPDGAWAVYERGHGDQRRRAYRGPASSALWLWNRATNEHHALTEFDGNDLQPMWASDSNEVYFLSDRACAGNEDGRDLGLWKVKRDGGEPQAVFHADGMTLRYANMGLNGRAVVAELDTSIVMIDTATGQARTWKAYGAIDGGEPNFQNRVVSSGVSDFSVSPDGETIAFVSGGDLYAMRKHDKIKRAVRITSNPAPDGNPIWVEDGDAILFLSERDGNTEFYRVRPLLEDEEFYQAREWKLERVTKTDFDESSASLSPDGEHLAWVQGAGKLVIGDPTTLEVSRVMVDGFEAPSFDWSPDSRWLTWSGVNDDFNYDVFLARAVFDEGEDAAKAEGATPVNLTLHPDDDTSPSWSPDGRKIVFTSQRMMNDEQDVWVCFLKREDLERTERERLEAAEAEKEAKKEAKKKEKEAKKEAEKKEKEAKKDEPVKGADAKQDAKAEKESTDKGDSEDDDKDDEKEKVDPVEIDLDDIHKRLVRLTRREGNERALGFSADSEKVYFNATTGTRLTSNTKAERGFFEVGVFDRKDKSLDSSPISGLLLHDEKVMILKSGKMSELKGDKFDFSVSIREDRQANRLAVMEEAWRALDRNFYDPEFHGHDWAASLAKWRPLIENATTPEDYGVFMNWMLGEMNASHMGFYGTSSSRGRETDSTVTGVLGVIWDETFSGPGRRVKEVVEGTPAARADSLLAAGDIVMSVNGVAYKPADNWANLFEGTVGKESFLTVLDAAKQQREVILRPSAPSDLRDALYRRFATQCRDQAEAGSAGRVGYIHIQGMGTGSLLEFERDLYAAGHGKDALLIDVRENGGGWTTDMTLAMLMVKDHARTIPRGGGEGYPQGRRVFATWDKPVVVLCNENSYSNAEIFSWAIKTLGRGPIVGKQTYGAVISTGGASLMGGAMVRLPFRGWYVNDKARTNMELNGCPPDYPVENLPGDYEIGLDRQLNKAIEVALDLIK